MVPKPRHLYSSHIPFIPFTRFKAIILTSSKVFPPPSTIHSHSLHFHLIACLFITFIFLSFISCFVIYNIVHHKVYFPNNLCENNHRFAILPIVLRTKLIFFVHCETEPHISLTALNQMKKMSFFRILFWQSITFAVCRIFAIGFIFFRLIWDIYFVHYIRSRNGIWLKFSANTIFLPHLINIQDQEKLNLDNHQKNVRQQEQERQWKQMQALRAQQAEQQMQQMKPMPDKMHGMHRIGLRIFNCSATPATTKTTTINPIYFPCSSPYSYLNRTTNKSNDCD